jgi:hypothetical protein
MSYFAESSLGGGGLRWEPVGKTVARFVGLAFFRGFAAPTFDFWVALAVFAVTILVLLAAAVRGRWLKAPAPSGPMSRLFAVLAVCLVVLYVVVPDGIGDGYNLKGRLQLIMWAWLLPSLPATKNLTARKAVIVGVAAVLLWQVVAFGTRARAFNASYDRALTAAAALPRGSILDRTSDYDHEVFDGSFIKVLAHAPEDVAYHCGCVLVAGYHPSTAFYWVRTLPTPGVLPAYRVDVRQGSGKDVSITITNRAAAPLAGAGGRSQHR